MKDAALTVIHEATHAKINKPNTKNQELECFLNECRHRGEKLTKETIKDTMKYIDDMYPYLKWEWFYEWYFAYANPWTLETFAWGEMCIM